MKVTVQTVAERAEVSVGTVSRVLNRDPSVSDALSKRVRKCIDDLGYVPLRKRRQKEEDLSLKGKTIGLLTLGMDRSLARLPVVTSAIDGIREAASMAGAFLQIIDIPDPASVPGWLKRTHFDGWLVKGALQGDIWEATHPHIKAHLESSPCVWFHGRPSSAPGWSVGVNDWETGALAARSLHDKGHRQVAFLSPKRNHLLLKRREHGFVATCEELGMKCKVSARDFQTWRFPLERPQSLAAVEALLNEVLQGRSRPTALFVPADSIAVLLYRALAERGLCVPDDVSVISANREEGLIASLFPALTTIDIRSEEVGRESVGQLHRLLNADEKLSRQDLQIEPELIAGESVLAL